MKRYADWLVGETLNGLSVRVNLSLVTEVFTMRDGGLRLYQPMADADGDQTYVDIDGTMAEWDEVILGIPSPEREGWIKAETYGAMRKHAASGRCVADVEGGLWYVCGEEATDEEMTPRYGSRVDAMVAVEGWWAAQETA